MESLDTARERFTPDFFIQKFEAIPEEKWCVGDYFNEQGQYCALGFTMKKSGGSANESFCLSELFGVHGALSVTHVNDGKDVRYPQATPKQRILAALGDIKNAKVG